MITIKMNLPKKIRSFIIVINNVIYKVKTPN